jgi:hypothetical protein
MRRCARRFLLILLFALFPVATSLGDPPTTYREKIKPILEKHCFDCHANGEKEGGVAFDGFATDEALTADRKLWNRVLRIRRAGVMPPADHEKLTDADSKALEEWIKYSVFQIDPKNPDPGTITVRRLNRVEYRNTIRDLLGVDFPTQAEFPADDSAHGFDTNADVLSLSPLLLEKYLSAAQTIVTKAVPQTSRAVAERKIGPKEFKPGDGDRLVLSYYKEAIHSATTKIEQAGDYQVVFELSANERYVENQFDYNKCKVSLNIDGNGVYEQEFVREGGKQFLLPFDCHWEPGDHTLEIALTPLTPEVKQIRTLTLRLDSVTIRGPKAKKHWVKPEGYDRFFSKEVPADAKGRRAFAKEILTRFATKAFRRPVDEPTVERLVALAESIYGDGSETFEKGVSQAMTAVLASPRFLYRDEEVVADGSPFPLIDEFSLASRLSYFLWSSMPDEELMRLAAEGKLRKQLPEQIKRMLADRKAEALTENFVGQWLQARDVDGVQINARAVLRREDAPPTGGQPGSGQGRQFGFRPPRAQLDFELKRAMKRESEMVFDYILREDRNMAEFLESDYTFLNEKLAKHYGLEDLKVMGQEMRLVKLPAESPRGGVLTQGTVLAVTSNPDRTSPVKRGLFVLDHILGTPAPPAPPDIPPLEDSAKPVDGRKPTLRESMEIHRKNPICASCHDRMDAFGLALENFNAMGMWREKEFQQPIDPRGKLITGQAFSNVRELKHILATEHKAQFYRTLAEKLLIYSLGRGLEDFDAETVDQLISRVESQEGRLSALITGLIESAPFQRARTTQVSDQRAAVQTTLKEIGK